MLSGAIDAIAARRAPTDEPEGNTLDALQPVVLGVSGGAIAAAAATIGMPASRMREIAVQFPEEQVLGRRSMRSLITRRTLYPDARIHSIARAVVGDRTFADFALPGLETGRACRSSLVVTVFSARLGTLFLPRDLWRLGVVDMPVADALVAATRIPGALPAAPGLEDLFDGATHHRVPYELFLPYPALLLDLYGPRPYRSLGGLALPAVHPCLPAIPVRPRPFRDAAVRDRTIFANVTYGSSFRSPSRQPGDLFDHGRRLATEWVEKRSTTELLAIADPHALGLETSRRFPLPG
ncbi:hypothetical protein BJY24_004268 [Nocardia transvalensis]|uniref:PNPLA domain-containing protein n=1 Tax=Nocardia transvalensis TaxID=37333 RepID=A0A7W9PFQ8_9NOCA|nr:patatin-like phospholipase family protein [Nocardia transvalensis]MBB5915356.1 hypothetical protein [Nocardia transvalensis]